MLKRKRLLEPNTNLPEPVRSLTTETYGVSNDELYIDVAATSHEPGQSDEMIINFLSWSGYVGRPDAQDGFRVMSDALNARIVSVDNLGVGDGTSSIPAEIRPQLQKGDFGPVTRLQYEALERFSMRRELGSVSLIGYSLGASMAASFAANAPEYTHIDRLFLWEVAGSRRQPTVALAAKFGLEALKWQQYFSDNPDWMNQPGNDSTMIARMRADAAGYVDYPRGLSRGRIVEDLLLAREREVIDEQTEIIIMSNAKSRVSSVADNSHMIKELLANDIQPRVWEQYHGESHGMIDSAPRVWDALREYR